MLAPVQSQPLCHTGGIRLRHHVEHQWPREDDVAEYTRGEVLKAYLTPGEVFGAVERTHNHPPTICLYESIPGGADIIVSPTTPTHAYVAGLMLIRLAIAADKSIPERLAIVEELCDADMGRAPRKRIDLMGPDGKLITAPPVARVLSIGSSVGLKRESAVASR